MPVDITKVQIFLETMVRVMDPDPARGGNNLCRDFGSIVYDEAGTSYHAAAKEALAEIARLDTDEIHDHAND